MSAKYIKTIYIKDKYNPRKTKEYSYKGHTYFIDFTLNNEYIGIFIGVSGEHKYQQDKIDKQIENENKITENTEDAQTGFDLFYKYANGNENAFDEYYKTKKGV